MESSAVFVNRHFNFQKVRIVRSDRISARIEGDFLCLSIDPEEPFFKDSYYSEMLIVREVYRAMYGYEGLAADIIANKSTIKAGFGDNLASYYYLLLTERKSKEITDFNDFIAINVAYLSFLGMDKEYSDMFLELTSIFSFPSVFKERARRIFSLSRNPYCNFSAINKEIVDF